MGKMRRIQIHNYWYKGPVTFPAIYFLSVQEMLQDLSFTFVGIICWSFNELGGPGENDQRNCQNLQASGVD